MRELWGWKMIIEDWGLRVEHWGLRINDRGLIINSGGWGWWMEGRGLRIEYWGLKIEDGGLRIEDWGSRIEDWGLRIKNAYFWSSFVANHAILRTFWSGQFSDCGHFTSFSRSGVNFVSDLNGIDHVTYSICESACMKVTPVKSEVKYWEALNNVTKYKIHNIKKVK